MIQLFGGKVIVWEIRCGYMMVGVPEISHSSLFLIGEGAAIAWHSLRAHIHWGRCSTSLNANNEGDYAVKC